MNAIRKMINQERVNKIATSKTNLTLVKTEKKDKNIEMVDGKFMTKDELNEKLAYFYEHGGPIMEL